MLEITQLCLYDDQYIIYSFMLIVGWLMIEMKVKVHYLFVVLLGETNVWQ